PPPPTPPPFPYTTLFRSPHRAHEPGVAPRRASVVVRREELLSRPRRGDRPGACHDSSDDAALRADEGRMRSPMDLPDRAMNRNGDRKSTRLNSSHLGISY